LALISRGDHILAISNPFPSNGVMLVREVHIREGHKQQSEFLKQGGGADIPEVFNPIQIEQFSEHRSFFSSCQKVEVRRKLLGGYTI
jgi:hypothetical protein